MAVTSSQRAPMQVRESWTFPFQPAWLLGGYLLIVPEGIAAMGVAAVFSPLIWPGTSIIWVPGGVMLLALSFQLFRWTRRLQRSTLTIDRSGLLIQSLRERRHGWDEIRSFRRGTTGGILARTPIVIVELAGDRAFELNPFKQYSRIQGHEQEAFIHRLCRELEELRLLSS